MGMDAVHPHLTLALSALGGAYGAFWLAVVIAVLVLRARDRLKPQSR